MSLLENLRSNLTSSIKEKDEIKKGILRVILGDLSTLESRSGKKPNDDDVKRVAKKLLEGNLETLKYTDNNPILHDKLVNENAFLNSLLPKTLSREEIKNNLDISVISKAKTDGEAIGMAMRHFKSSKMNVEGTEVAEVVMRLRKGDA